MKEFLDKLTSRKFLISLAAFLASIATGITGIVTDHEWVTIVGAVCGVLSAAIYAAVEASVDKAAAIRTNTDVSIYPKVVTSDGETDINLDELYEMFGKEGTDD